MPTYNYRCPSCREELEVSTQVYDPPTDVACPSCQSLMKRDYSKMTLGKQFINAEWAKVQKINREEFG